MVIFGGVFSRAKRQQNCQGFPADEYFLYPWYTIQSPVNIYFLTRHTDEQFLNEILSTLVLTPETLCLRTEVLASDRSSVAQPTCTAHRPVKGKLTEFNV